MRALAATLLLAAAASLAACGPRRAEVSTAPSTQALVAIHMTNGLSQAVNVYVAGTGADMFVRQVAANSTEHLPVRGIAPGTTVTLKATTVDGARTYEKRNVVLSGTYSWAVP